MSKKIQPVDTRGSIRVVTSNDFITAKGLSELSLKARKLLYIAIAQCKITDEEFYSYEISVKQFADLMGIQKNHVYDVANTLTDELLKLILCIKSNGKYFEKYTVFSSCKYENGIIAFKLNPDMTHFLLQLKENFTKPLLRDFLRMNSSYSMAVWNLMQREMKSSKPDYTHVIEFDLSLDELRDVTNTQDKLKQIGQFKEKVLDKALKEIEESCSVRISYENIKNERIVTGFHFKATNMYHIPEAKISQISKDKGELFQLKEIKKKRPLTYSEQERLEFLEDNTGQLNLILNL